MELMNSSTQQKLDSDGTTPPRASMAASFGSLLGQLIESLSVVFPECLDTKEVLIVYRNMVDEETLERLMDMWYEQISGVHERAIREREPEPLLRAMEEHEVLRKLGMRRKWSDPGFEREHQEVVWEYVDGLAGLANMRRQIPRGMLGHIESAANGLASGDLASLDLAQIGQQVLADANENEIEEFAGNIEGIFGALSGSLGEQGRGQLPQGGGVADLSGLQGLMAMAAMRRH